MKAKHLVSLLFIVLALQAVAQKRQSVVWKVSGNGLKQPSYLLGTIHIADFRQLKHRKALLKLAQQCSAGVFELTGEGITDPELDAKAYPPLDSVFTPREYAVVDSFFVKAGFGSIKDHNNDASLPAMIQAAAMVRVNKQSGITEFLDDYFKEQFTNWKKPLLQLDDVNIRARNDITTATPKEMAAFLVKFIERQKAYPASDLNAAIKLDRYTKSLTYDLKLQQTPPKIGPMAPVHLQTAERNRLWIPILTKHMAQQSCFAVFGVGHLQYKTGVINLLLARGYTVKPVVLAD